MISVAVHAYDGGNSAVLSSIITGVTWTPSGGSAVALTEATGARVSQGGAGYSGYSSDTGLWYLALGDTSSSVAGTIAVSGSNNIYAVAAVVWDNTDQTTPISSSSGAGAYQNSTAARTSSLGSLNSNDTAFAAYGWDSAGRTQSGGTNITLTNGASMVNPGISADYSTAASPSITWTPSPATWRSAAFIATIKGYSAGGVAVSCGYVLIQRPC
jgi:hypothetical protein